MDHFARNGSPNQHSSGKEPPKVVNAKSDDKFKSIVIRSEKKQLTVPLSRHVRNLNQTSGNKADVKVTSVKVKIPDRQ